MAEPQKADVIKSKLESMYSIPVAMSKAVREGINAGKKYKMILNKSGTNYLEWVTDVSSEQVEDEAFSRYDPGWTNPTAPFDSRYPHQNQKPNCERNYIDYHRCLKIKGEDYPNCNYFKAVYMQLCPKAWVDDWDEQIASGTFRYDTEK
ncbi:uncharacterized protein LOC127856429 [Dreissena polymorpha]|uniref:Uncharacterized protein n=1 Tax=Dreissena polymorpha TaxID=45954 RepID=A0A9D4HFJ8_DREPO|nr:uncharacterized protein LOC127856429 [Dreissena polymorpha]KAH3717320.1 hypothetical protein DPMN_060103 [Dreissena polymorpha]